MTVVVMFIALPQPFAAVHIQQRDDEESERDANHQQVPHGVLLLHPLLAAYNQTKPTVALFR
jgi:hypothetical protein